MPKRRESRVWTNPPPLHIPPPARSMTMPPIQIPDMGKWHHVVGTLSCGTWRVYIDGQGQG
jgi:hypothetical protein